MAPELTYLYAVYTEGSFSKAAEKLFITQPALSIAIKKIEDEIGMPLFDRKKKPLKLTDAGEIYIDAIKKMQITEMESRQKINAEEGQENRHLKKCEKGWSQDCLSR